MTSMADDGVSVLLSSHAIAELERMADYLVVLGGGELRLAGETDELLGDHRVLTGPAGQADLLAGQLSPVQDKRAGAQAHLLVRTGGPAGEVAVPPQWEAHPVSLEEVILAYLRPDGGASSAAAPDSRTELTDVTR
jgi:ABC-2 type transport system ATP-binding protein